MDSECINKDYFSTYLSGKIMTLINGVVDENDDDHSTLTIGQEELLKFLGSWIQNESFIPSLAQLKNKDHKYQWQVMVMKEMKPIILPLFAVLIPYCEVGINWIIEVFRSSTSSTNVNSRISAYTNLVTLYFILVGKKSKYRPQILEIFRFYFFLFRPFPFFLFLFPFSFFVKLMTNLPIKCRKGAKDSDPLVLTTVAKSVGHFACIHFGYGVLEPSSKFGKKIFHVPTITCTQCNGNGNGNGSELHREKTEDFAFLLTFWKDFLPFLSKKFSTEIRVNCIESLQRLLFHLPTEQFHYKNEIPHECLELLNDQDRSIRAAIGFDISCSIIFFFFLMDLLSNFL